MFVRIGSIYTLMLSKDHVELFNQLSWKYLHKFTRSSSELSGCMEFKAIVICVFGRNARDISRRILFLLLSKLRVLSPKGLHVGNSAGNFNKFTEHRHVVLITRTRHEYKKQWDLFNFGTTLVKRMN